MFFHCICAIQSSSRPQPAKCYRKQATTSTSRGVLQAANDVTRQATSQCTTKDEIAEALSTSLSAPHINKDAVKTLRKAYAGTQVAVTALPDDLVAKARKLGHIRIGWVNFCIRGREDNLRCYRCWSPGHVPTRCKGLDRSALPLRTNRLHWLAANYQYRQIRKPHPRRVLWSRVQGLIKIGGIITDLDLLQSPVKTFKHGMISVVRGSGHGHLRTQTIECLHQRSDRNFEKRRPKAANCPRPTAQERLPLHPEASVHTRNKASSLGKAKYEASAIARFRPSDKGLQEQSNERFLPEARSCPRPCVDKPVLPPSTEDQSSPPMMRILQLNLNHCKAAQDLLSQTILEQCFNVAVVCDQYKNLDPPYTWLADANSQAPIWVQGGVWCRNAQQERVPFQLGPNQRNLPF
ncbi:unnamed protein product [Trichogramma brassicae]|uniref:CCHC-type domain-containing protein n=1 Tax=Trichogramma brassicae TaxID=86971 RepID=A0A6H5IWU3_9HYME|nr:unnamed protein product [Trichogramma brassicae]